MIKSEFHVGQEIAIIIYVDKQSVGEIVSSIVDEDAQMVGIFTDDQADLKKMLEALKAAVEAVTYHLTKPDLRAMIKARIAEMDDAMASEEGEPPSPAHDDVEDIPF